MKNSEVIITGEEESLAFTEGEGVAMNDAVLNRSSGIPDLSTAEDIDDLKIKIASQAGYLSLIRGWLNLK